MTSMQAEGLLSATHLFSLLIGFFYCFVPFLRVFSSMAGFLIPVYLQLILRPNIQRPSSVGHLSYARCCLILVTCNSAAGGHPQNIGFLLPFYR